MISLRNLFHPKKSRKDGLTQSQREAIVDLLNYCSFVDHDIADSEEVLIDDLANQLDWDRDSDFDYYVNKSVGQVRNVLESKDGGDDFIAGIRERLDSKKSRALALQLSEKLIRADGKMSPEESQTFQAIRQAIG